MKRLLILGAASLATSAFVPSVSTAQTIECASEPAARGGHWYYRIIDGRKCWYQGKPMLPKSSLRWPDSLVAEADEPVSKAPAATPTAQATKPATDGRNASAPAAPEPAAWPTPTADDNSFESRWLGLSPARR